MVSLVVLVFGWLKLFFPPVFYCYIDLWFLFIFCGCVSKLAYAIVSKEAHSGMNSNSMETTNFGIQTPTLYYCSGLLLFLCTRLIKNGWEFAWSHLSWQVARLLFFQSFWRVIELFFSWQIVPLFPFFSILYCVCSL